MDCWDARNAIDAARTEGTALAQHLAVCPTCRAYGRQRNQPTGVPRMPHLSGLDGLRGLALIAVLWYHANAAGLPGGFLGVEVFFVLSGYLVTALLRAEWRHHGRVDLGRFWARRVQRLVPALLLTIVGMLVFAVLVLPTEVASLRDDALAGLGYVANWYFVFAQQPYFETVGRPPLLQHLWSLAIEGQLYLLWPLVFVVVRRWSRCAALLVALAGCAASAMLMAYLYQHGADTTRLYYGSDTRAAGFLLGAALALVWLPLPAWRRTWRLDGALFDLVGLLALGELAWLCLVLDPYQPWLYQGGFVLVALLTTITITAATYPGAVLGRLLDWRPLRWVGLRSYSIYLWHWPVFTVTRPQLDIALDGLPLLVLRLVVTGVLAECSYRFVEQPFRRGAAARLWRRWRTMSGASRWRWDGVAGAATVLLVALVVAVVRAQPATPPAYLAVESLRIHAARPVAAAERASPTATFAGNDPTPALHVPLPLVASVSPSEPAMSPPPFLVPSTAVPALEPAPTAAPSSPFIVTAVGDSVMLGAATQLVASVESLDLDAANDRQVAVVIALLRDRHDSGQLGDVVTVHIGNNGPFTPSQFDAMMQALADVPTVLVVNLKAPRPWEAANNAVIADGTQRYRNAMLVDWHAASFDRPELFWDDGTHLRSEGAQVYAALIEERLRVALNQ